MPLMKHKDGRRIAASADRVDSLIAEGFMIERSDNAGDAKNTAPVANTNQSKPASKDSKG